MAVGDRLTNPEGDGYSSYEVTDENVVNGRKQAAKLVKIVGDDGSTSAPATSAKQDEQTAVLGAVADAAVVTDANGTLSAKLRGLVKWAFERMPASLGQKTKAASLPVVIASDQDVLATSANQTTANNSLALLEPAARCAAVAPNDGADLANNTRALMVSVAGNVKVDFVTTGTAVILTGLQPGTVYPFRVKRVYSTDTTATGILALW